MIKYFIITLLYCSSLFAHKTIGPEAGFERSDVVALSKITKLSSKTNSRKTVSVKVIKTYKGNVKNGEILKFIYDNGCSDYSDDIAFDEYDLDEIRVMYLTKEKGKSQFHWVTGNICPMTQSEFEEDRKKQGY